MATKTAWKVSHAVCQLLALSAAHGAPAGNMPEEIRFLEKPIYQLCGAETTPWGLAALGNQGLDVFSKDNTPLSSVVVLGCPTFSSQAWWFLTLLEVRENTSLRGSGWACGNAEQGVQCLRLLLSPGLGQVDGVCRSQ